MDKAYDVEKNLCYPLSSLQQGMLFHWLSAPQAGTDVEQMVCTLHEELNISSLRRAWARVVERHEVLRTSFSWREDGYSEQCVLPHVDLPWYECDWRDLSTDDQADRLKRFYCDDRRRGFDLGRAPMSRVTLLRLGETEYRLVWTFHHAILDGRSFPIVLKEVFGCYEAYCIGQEMQLDPPIPYRAFIDWLQHQDPAKAESHWRQRLAGFSAPTPLVVDRIPSSSVQIRDRQADERVYLTGDITCALKSFAQENQLRLGTLVQGAWALLLSRYSGEEDVVFGTVRACRKSTIDGADDMVGLFINTLPIRVSVTPGALLVDWLKRLQLQWRDLRSYEHTPLVCVQAWSEVPGGKPLFESILMFENYQLDALLSEQGGSWANRSFRLFEQTNFPITVTVYSGMHLCIQIEFDRSRFDPQTISRMLGHMKVLLESMLQGPLQRLDELSMLTQEERNQLLVEWNATRVNYPADALLHELFEAQAERTPSAIAVDFDGKQLSYGELNDRANRLARHLRKVGTEPDTRVAVCMERSLDLVVALYGILKAGGAYVPIDPEYPQDRVAFMLQDSAASVLLTQTRLADSIRNRCATVICLDGDWDQIAREDSGNPSVSMSPDNLAYMIYTSGSTGKPKGALNTHRGICNRLLWMQDHFALTSKDQVLQKTPFSFDVSVWELFWPLLVGARMVVAAPGGHRDPAYLVNLIRERQITVAHFVPSMLRIFLEEAGSGSCRSLRYVICSGEALPFDLQERFFELLPSELHNLYGPTEAAVDVTSWTCRRNDQRRMVPIGKPIANTQVYILDRHRHPVPIGVPGELHIGGVQVGRGYHNRPDLTEERFIPDPYGGSPAARLYKTGDLCRWLEDGSIEYLGRMDFQVKIRGFRIELGEVESVLASHALVRRCLVTAREDEKGERHLVAYVVWLGANAPPISEVREYLMRKLPDYMVPSAFISLPEIPMAPNGKVDLRALPAADESQFSAESAKGLQPIDEVERTIADIWREVLAISSIDRESNFFDLGGDSIRLMRVRVRLQQAFHKEFEMLDLLQCSSVRSLASHVRGEAEEVAIPQQGSAEIIARRDAAQRRRALRGRILN